MHGAAAPAAREAAARRELEARTEVVLERLDVAPVTDPVSALLKVSAETLALRDWLADQFNAADNDSAFLLAEALGRGLDRASRLLIEIHRLGLEQRQAALDERQGRTVASVIAASLAACGVDPTAQHVRKTVRRELERIGEPGYEPQSMEHWRQQYERQREATQ